ncbi:MAG: hypothetical protein HQK77_10330 [Desulfobacterales bacterium]|nr:hypothetical protein [Desulfobacterales bacterium]
MHKFSKDIAAYICKRSGKVDLGELSLDTQMLTVLMELNGQKMIKDIGKDLNITISNLREILNKLYALNLFEIIHKPLPIIGSDLYDYLKEQFSLAVGPLSETIIEDEIHDMGEQLNKMPIHRLSHLVLLLARQIPRAEKRIAFQHVMMGKIKNIYSASL